MKRIFLPICSVLCSFFFVSCAQNTDIEHETITASLEQNTIVQETPTFAPIPTQSADGQEQEADITTFVTFDWTADSVLWEHSLQPLDSAQGWEFSVADIDFDGVLEMLVTFPANHCGQNCVYIYKQENGAVRSYADTLAVFEEHIVFGTDYKKLSPFLDIALLDAYVDNNGSYRYLSLDNSSFGGGIYTLYLYETDLQAGTAPKELVRIEEVSPSQEQKLYFLGEQVYEPDTLRELLAAYMEGYTKREICYKTVSETFPRDLIAWSDEEKRQELELLYDALLSAFNRPYQ